MKDSPGLAAQSYYFEDLVEGATFVSRARTVTETDVVGFAGLSGDFNPIHLDRTSTAAGTFGQRIAHGVLGLALATGFMDSLGLFRTTMDAMLSIDDWRFLKPVFINDSLHLRVTIESTRLTTRGGRGVVKRRMQLVNQDGDIVQEGFMTVLIKSRSHINAD